MNAYVKRKGGTVQRTMTMWDKGVVALLCVCSAVSSRCTKRSSNAQLLFSFSWLPLLADVGYVVHGLAKARTMPSAVEFLVSVVGAYAHYSVAAGRPRSTSQLCTCRATKACLFKDWQRSNEVVSRQPKDHHDGCCFSLWGWGQTNSLRHEDHEGSNLKLSGKSKIMSQKHSQIQKVLCLNLTGLGLGVPGLEVATRPCW